MEKTDDKIKDPYDGVLECIAVKRKIICEEFGRHSKEGFSVTLSNARDTKFGDCRHHKGINIKSKNEINYFIGFTGLNIDVRTSNIHSSLGRIQLFIGDGNPNLKHKFDEIIMYEIKYPRNSDKSLKKIDKYGLYSSIESERCAFNTGYCIFGNVKSGDVLVDEINVRDFYSLIKNFVNMYEERLKMEE